MIAIHAFLVVSLSLHRLHKAQTSSVLLPEAVLTKENEEEKNSADECGDSKAHERASQVVLDCGNA